MSTRYDDILEHPRVVTPGRRPMPMLDRAAQFAPFAALTGYDEAVIEAGRYTNQRVELDPAQQELLDRRLQYLRDHAAELPTVTVTYFVPDEKKAGGANRTITDQVKRMRLFERTLELRCGASIAFDAIHDLQGVCFAPLDWV